jgi:hypothetical protein
VRARTREIPAALDSGLYAFLKNAGQIALEDFLCSLEFGEQFFRGLLISGSSRPALLGRSGGQVRPFPPVLGRSNGVDALPLASIAARLPLIPHMGYGWR